MPFGALLGPTRKLRLDEIAIRLVDLEQEVERFGELAASERAARLDRWLDGSGPRNTARFAALAVRLAANFGSAGDAHDWARVGGLWHLAGDDVAARPWLRKAVKERRWRAMPHVRAGAWYLLGEFDDAVRLGGDGVEARVAEAARSRAVAGLPLVREQLVDIAMAFTNGPSDAVGDPLTTWDWLEESFLLESRLTGAPVPSHLEMLDRLGVLSDDPKPPVPPPLSPEVGLRRSDLHGRWLHVTKDDEVVMFVAADVFVVLRRQFGLWGARITDDPEEPSEWVTEPEFPDWRHAASEAARRIGLYVGKREGDAITDLAVLAGGDAGEAVPKPRELAGPPPPVVYPTVEFTSHNIVDIELAADLLLQFREPWDSKGWYGRIAHEALAPMDDVVPGPHETWQDAARAMVRWLTEHQNGRGAAELEQLIREHS